MYVWCPKVEVLQYMYNYIVYFNWFVVQAKTFNQLLEASGGSEEDGYKALTALGLISAIQSLVKSAYKTPEILKELETILIPTIVSIFKNGVMGTFDAWT